MDFAINKVTGLLVSASEISGVGRYLCPVCKAMVNHRSGVKRKPYFAHWPGYGSRECENYAPGPNVQVTPSQTLTSDAMRRMELRLLITKRLYRIEWSIELVLPPCQECHASVTLDVGGRLQTLDMRGMVKSRCVTAELSVSAYRIVSFSGKPDPCFVHGVERECMGLPTCGAAVFTTSGSKELAGFPRAQELRGSETFAMLWREPIETNFPDELVVSRLPSRQGWSLALVSIPDIPSSECATWLNSFTGLPIASPSPAIIPIWPFLTTKSSVNEIECIKSGIVLLSAVMMPMGQGAQGPTLEAKGSFKKRSAVGVERTPAFFVLKPEGVDFVEIAEVNSPAIKEFISLSLHSDHHVDFPSVELAFLTPQGTRRLLSLHKPKCAEMVVEARAHGMTLEYLSMPLGAQGTLYIEGPDGSTNIPLSSGGGAPPHNRHLSLPPSDVLTTLISALANPACLVEIEFGGYGRLHIPRSLTCSIENTDRKVLNPALRSRILSYMYQLQLAGPIAKYVDDALLVQSLATIKPKTPLIPHYRSLVKEILTSGFDVKYYGDNISS